MFNIVIGIIDYNSGNLSSMERALTFLGCQTKVISKPQELKSCAAIILPGVGAFDSAMGSLNKSGMAGAIKDHILGGKPLLGICLGMQILFDSSDEGLLGGLSILSGQLVNLSEMGCVEKIPHVGFNTVNALSLSSGFIECTDNKDFYFIHSYGVRGEKNIYTDSAVVTYGKTTFLAALLYKNIYATQFHPEKSGVHGIKLIEQFLQCLKKE